MKTLLHKLQKIQAELATNGIGKKKLLQVNYDGHNAELVIGIASRLLADNRIMLVSDVVGQPTYNVTTRTTTSGKTQDCTDASVVLRFTATCLDTGESMVLGSMAGAAVCFGSDKALGAALTYAQRDGFLRFFWVPTPNNALPPSEQPEQLTESKARELWKQWGLGHIEFPQCESDGDFLHAAHTAMRAEIGKLAETMTIDWSKLAAFLRMQFDHKDAQASLMNQHPAQVAKVLAALKQKAGAKK